MLPWERVQEFVDGVTIDDHDVRGCLRQPLGSVETGKTAADDEDLLAVVVPQRVRHAQGAPDREIRPGEGVVQQGSTLSYTRGMRLADRPVLVTVVGEVPVNTARMVADSLRWDG